MAKKIRVNKPDISTGDKVIEIAKKRGASVTPNAHGRFTAIETERGKMHILPGRQMLDKRTQSNVRRWLKLLGIISLLIGLLALVDFLWGLVSTNPLIVF